MNRNSYRVTVTYTLNGKTRRTGRTVDARNENSARCLAAGSVAYDVADASDITVTTVTAK